MAEQHDLPAVALRASLNLAQVSLERDRYEDAVTQLEEALAVARERGDRLWERSLSAHLVISLCVLGRWDEAVRVGASVIAGEHDIDSLSCARFLVSVAAARGDERDARALPRAGRRDARLDLRRPASGAMIIGARSAIESGLCEEALGFAGSS